jgi:hypothetical protein
VTRKSTEPTSAKILVLLAAQGNPGTHDGWLFSDEIQARLKMFGYRPTSQKLVALLKAMCEEDAPRFESEMSPWNVKRYRVTQWGRNDLDNKLPGLRRAFEPLVVITGDLVERGWRASTLESTTRAEAEAILRGALPSREQGQTKTPENSDQPKET